MTRWRVTLLVTLLALLVGAAAWWLDPWRVGITDGVAAFGEPLEIVVGWLALVAAVWLWPRRGARVRTLLFVLLLVALVGSLWRLTRSPRPEALGEEVGAVAANSRRTVIVGLDGLTWSRVLPLVEAGKLPNLAAMMREGAYGVLDSVRAVRPTTGESGYWSPVVWTSIATGVTPDKHGVTDFNIAGAGGRLDLAASVHRRVPAFWNLWGAFGQRVGVVGWWASWPAEEVRGVMVSSGVGLRGRRGADDAEGPRTANLTFPEELVDELPPPAVTGDVTKFIDRRLFPISSYPLLAEGDRATFESVVWQDRYYLEISRRLLEREAYRLFAVYFEGTDLVGHLFWRYLEDPSRLYGLTVPDGFDEHARIVDRYYGVVDRYLGELVELAGDDATIVVCSDHGFRGDPASEQLADHSRRGVLLMRGPGIRRGFDLGLSLAGGLRDAVEGAASVLDLLPTLLYMHALPISSELDGRVLYRLFEPSYLAANPELRVTGYGDFAATRKVEIELPESEREEYLERLRSLGYVD